MTGDEAVRLLDDLTTDPEAAHWRADEIILAVLPEAVRAAYERAVERCGGFWYS